MSANTYVPTRDDLLTVIQLLHENGIDVSNSKAAYAQLKTYEANPSFCILLATVFRADVCPVPDIQLPVAWSQYRQLAGITLKNNIEKARHALGEVAVTEAARCALQTLTSPPDERIARVSAQIIVKITTLTSFQWWVESGLGDLANILLNELLSAGGLKTLAALYALQYLMEDLPKQIGLASEGIIKKASQLSVTAECPENLRKASFRMCFNIYEQSSLLDWNVDTLSPLQQGLVNASYDFSRVCTLLLHQLPTSETVFKIQVLRSCLFLIDYFDYFHTISGSDIQSMSDIWVRGAIGIICTKQQIAEGGTEMIAASIELVTYLLETYDGSAGEGLISYLVVPVTEAMPVLIGALIDFSFMSEDEVSTIMENDDYRIRDATAVSCNAGGESKDISTDNLLEDAAAAMTLRSCALRCVDALCSFSSTTAFTTIVNKVRVMWESSDWTVREAGIVLVGTMANGCSSEIEGSLLSIAEQLLCFVEDPSQHVCVVSIAIWSLSRLSENIFEVLPNHFSRIVTAVIGRLQSTSRRIQHASVTALNNLVLISQPANSTVGMAQHFPALLSTIYTCMSVYTTTNLSQLMDLLIGLIPQLNDGTVLSQLSTKLKEERERRAFLFQESYTKTYVGNDFNAFVDKDVFSIDRAIVGVLSLRADSAFGCESLHTWSGVLKDIVLKDIFDDPDLVGSTLLLSCGYSNTLPTAGLKQWITSTSWELPTAAYQLLTSSKNHYVISGSVTVLASLLRALGKDALPQGMHDALLERLSVLVTEEDDPHLKGDAVRLITLMVSNYPGTLSNAATAGLAAASGALRIDAFGTSLLYFVQMAFDLCRPLEKAPQLVSVVNVSSISNLMAQAENSMSKAEATVRLCNALRGASPQLVSGHIQDVLRLVYSWHQAAQQYPGTAEAIQALLHCISQSCGNLLAESLAPLHASFREVIVSTYHL